MILYLSPSLMLWCWLDHFRPVMRFFSSSVKSYQVISGDLKYPGVKILWTLMPRRLCFQDGAFCDGSALREIIADSQQIWTIVVDECGANMFTVWEQKCRQIRDGTALPLPWNRHHREGKLSGLFCAVLCAAVVHSTMHTHIWTDLTLACSLDLAFL